MTKVASIMTNGLFGMGRKWDGKIFHADMKGTNRFLNRDGVSKGKEHPFDFSIQESRLWTGESLQFRYANYQSPFSLWKSMHDEVRIIPGDVDVMIGFGSMAWSGGMLNATPFCLWRSKPKTKTPAPEQQSTEQKIE